MWHPACERGRQCGLYGLSEKLVFCHCGFESLIQFNIGKQQHRIDIRIKLTSPI